MFGHGVVRLWFTLRHAAALPSSQCVHCGAYCGCVCGGRMRSYALGRPVHHRCGKLCETSVKWRWGWAAWGDGGQVYSSSEGRAHQVIKWRAHWKTLVLVQPQQRSRTKCKGATSTAGQEDVGRVTGDGVHRFFRTRDCATATTVPTADGVAQDTVVHNSLPQDTDDCKVGTVRGMRTGSGLLALLHTTDCAPRPEIGKLSTSLRRTCEVNRSGNRHPVGEITD
uniref:pH-response regulator protein palH/RIM21 n=1 Tax=Lygus hesperus TaxID=30085 RepID=A0A0A9X8K1_LYGHE